MKYLAIPYIRLTIFLLLLLIGGGGIMLLFDLVGFHSFIIDDALVFLLIIVISSIVIEKFRGKSKYYLWGIKFDKYAINDILTGLLLALSSFIIFFVIYFLYFETMSINPNFDFSQMLFSTKAILVALMIEEFVFRGIIFQSLIGMMGNAKASVFISLIFTFFHIYNPQVNFIALLNTFIASMLFCAMYIQTKSLWLPISFHFFWNLFQPLIIGSNLSGTTFMKLFIFEGDYQSTISNILLGGNYGIEGSLTALIILILIFIFVLKKTKTSPYITSLLFKRKLYESQLRYDKNK